VGLESEMKWNEIKEKKREGKRRNEKERSLKDVKEKEQSIALWETVRSFRWNIQSFDRYDISLLIFIRSGDYVLNCISLASEVSFMKLVETLEEGATKYWNAFPALISSSQNTVNYS
jgi:hypothetical protein